MALVLPSNGFIADIEAAIFAKVLADLGVDSILYPTPKCIQIAWAGRSGGRPVAQRIEENLPGFWMEYLAGGSKKTEFGHGSRVPSFATEIWNVYTVVNLTPEKLGCERDEQQFYKYCSRAADTLMRREILLLSDFDPMVVDGVLGYVTNGQRITWWGFVGVHRADLDIDWTIALRYEALVERA